MNPDIHICDLTSLDTGALMRLGQETFGNQFARNPQAYFKWKYFTGPVAPARGLVARLGNDIVGAYSVMPVKLLFNGSTICGAISFDTMISPKYQRQGLFIRLAQRLYELLEAEGFNLIYGFPNNGAMRGFVNHLGWERTNSFTMGLVPSSTGCKCSRGMVKRLSLKLAVGPAAAICAGGFRVSTLTSRDIRMVRMPDFDDRLRDVWTGCDKTQWQIGLVRDGDFLKWRFFENPEHSYHVFLALSNTDRPVGYIVFRIEPGKLIRTAKLMDFNSISTFNSKMSGMIIKAYLELHNAAEADGLMVCVPDEGRSATEPLHMLFRITGRLFTRLSKRSNPVLGIKLLGRNSLYTENFRSDLWHITPADMDWL